MGKSLSVLFVTSEVIPYVKVGGIADVSYSLPLALRDIGHDIRVMIPKYGCVSERKNRIHEINRLRDVPITIGKTTELATVKSSSIFNPRVKVQAYITTNQRYFDSKKGIYDNLKNGKPYSDNDERFIFFNRSVIETCLILGWFPDIIHCNDWQSALIPAYARVLFPNKFKKTKIVFTIHNFSQQGVFPVKTFEKTGLPESIKDKLTHKERFNFMKSGLVYSDYLTTVSKTYQDEILKDNKHSNDLNSILIEKKGRFAGILNGIDNWSWDPKNDTAIIKNFSDDFGAFKKANKQAVLKKFDLDYKEDVPLIAMITRLDAQKGIPLLLQAADILFSENIQLILLGEGSPDYKSKLKEIAKKHSDKFSVIFEFDEELAHQIEAGSDMFLLPSKFEPCGLNALYSLAYGSVPIVRATGGLIDIIKNYDEKTKSGNGFVFSSNATNDLLKAIKRATELYKNKELWESLALNGMKGDYSWKESVKQYDEIYRSII